jgi:DNA-binding response OmpR family regulator
MIHQFCRGHESRLSQLYSKVVSIGSQQPKREITNDVVEAAIEELARLADMLEKSSKKNRNNDQDDRNNRQNDRMSIEQLAKELETGAASSLKVDRNKTQVSVTAKSRGNGSQEITLKTGAGNDLPKILVVDDSPTIRAVVNKALGNDFSIVQASDGEDAWHYLLANNEIELVVTDLMMPILDGYSLIERIRSNNAPPYLAGIPIIVVTTLEDANAKLRALVCGANDFITKSTDAVELQARVLARYRLAKTLKETAKQKSYDRKSNTNVSTPSYSTSNSTSNSASLSAKGVTGSVKSQAKPAAQTNILQNKASAGGKPDATKPGAHHSSTIARDTATAGVQNRFAVNKANQLEAMAGVSKFRFNSTIAITLTATLLIILIFVGITQLNKSDPINRIKTEQVGEITPTKDSGVNTINADSQQQRSSEQATSSDVSKSASSSSQPDVPPKTAASVVTGKDIAAPKAESMSTKPVEMMPSAKLKSSPADKAAPQAVSPGASQKTKLPDPAANSDSSKTIVATEKPAKSKSSIEKSSAVENASSTASTSATLPGESQPTQQLGPGASTDTTVARSKVEPEAVTIAPAIPTGHISQAELVSLLKKFVFVYEAGDINQFLSLFDQNVRTNDRSTKEGLREDYEGLFNTTELRQMILGNVNWELRENKADGWGNFEVKVRKKGEQTIKAFNGSLTFHVVKNDGRLLIRHLYHGQRRAGGV